MAQATVRLPVTGKWAYIDSNTPIGVIDITEKTEVPMFVWYGAAPNWKGSQLFFQVEAFPEALSKKRIYYATAKFAFRSDGNFVTKYRFMNAKEDFDPETLEYSNKPTLYGSLDISTDELGTGQTYRTFKDYEMQPGTNTATYLSTNTCIFLRYPTHVLVNTKSSSTYQNPYGFAKLWTLSDDVSLPYIEVTYDDSISIGSNIKVANAPTSGYVNPRESTSFSWIYEKDTSSGYDCFGENYGQSSATFYWKTNSDESYASIPISGTTQGITIPANTFPINSTIQWYVQGTDDGGTTSQTDVYSFSTSAGAVTVTLVSPKSTIESNNAPITFKWSYSSPDGFPASRYALKWREMGATEWNTIVDSQDVTNSYTVPANTFPAGEIQWGVLPYNIDGTAGSGSVASFISFGAPEAPPVTTDAVPFLTVSWQSDDQQAYEISIGENVYGPYFGTEKSFKLAEPLADGTYTVKVRVMGEYGLWSLEGSTSVNITNVQGETITLGSMEALDNCIMWTTEEETADFLIYRDGKWIGHTESGSFRDRYVTGTHAYQVLNRLPDGNYSASGELTLTAATDCVYIALLSGSDWLKLEIPREGQKDPEFTKSAESFYGHLAGDVYPSAIVSGYCEDSMSFGATFLQEHEADRQRFEAMLGKSVIMKLRDGSVIFGILDNLKKEHKKLSWTAYSFTLRRIEWEDFVDDTQ